MKPYLEYEVNSSNATGETVRQFIRRIIPRYFGTRFEQDSVIAIADLGGKTLNFWIEVIGQSPLMEGHYQEYQIVIKSWYSELGEESARVVFSSLMDVEAMKPREALTIAAHLAGDYIKAVLSSHYYTGE